MQTIDDSRLLDACERMRPLPRPWREVALLSAVTARSVDAIAALPLGERDRHLLDVRARVFGTGLECRTCCPACAGELEWSLDATSLRVPPEPTTPVLTLDGGITVVCRAPDSRDIAACVHAADSESTLFARCVDVPRHDEDEGAPTLSPAAREQVQAHLARLDPEAEMQMALTCPACGHAWTSTFDPAAYVLEEIETHAERLLDEVHTLASAYGWTEADILRMPRRRRQRYLERVLG